MININDFLDYLLNFLEFIKLLVLEKLNSSVVKFLILGLLWLIKV